jgi:hypothetical protein
VRPVRAALVTIAALAALAAAAPAQASSSVRYGIHDDAWLIFGPGTLEDRIGRLESLGVDIVRFTVRWDDVARERPEQPRSSSDPAYRWGHAAAVLEALNDHGIDVVVTLLGTPKWANGDRTPNFAPTRGADFADFAAATADRFPWVRDWTIWNEPNQQRWLRPTTAAVYVNRLLNPAYAALHRVRPDARVAGGVTAPRGNAGGVSPVRWIRGMGAGGARLDAYAHHPYPLKPRIESPSSQGCTWWRCETITMGSLGRLVTEVDRAFGPKRIWLTEYGYQTNPPDRTILGVSYEQQARYLGEAALIAYRHPRVDMLIQFLVQDDAVLSAWQSGLYTVAGKPKPASRAFPLPLAQVSRRGTSTTLWGQVRPRSGVQPYRLRVLRGASWKWLGPVQRTDARGVFAATVPVGAGDGVQVWSPRDQLASPMLVLR